MGGALIAEGPNFACLSHPVPRLILLAGVLLERRLDFVFPAGPAANPATRRFLGLLESR